MEDVIHHYILGKAIWCYRCTSATPGCAETFNWRGIGYWGASCPEDNDICVKLTERKGGISILVNKPIIGINISIFFAPIASVTITRDCLSTFRGFRTDVPADHYEGCRKAAKDVRLAHYVFNNTIKELDIRRDHFDSTEFCFCFLDHRCNSSSSMLASVKLLGATIVGILIFRILP